MKVYPYTDENKGDFDPSGNSSRYFTSLRKARASARQEIPSGKVTEIRVEEIGSINTDLVLRLLNSEGFVVKSTPAATEIGQAEYLDE